MGANAHGEPQKQSPGSQAHVEQCRLRLGCMDRPWLPSECTGNPEQLGHRGAIQANQLLRAEV